MLLDEPSSGLDVHETEQLGDALRRVRQERGTAFVLVEHNVEFVLELSEAGDRARLRPGAHRGHARRDPQQQRGPGRILRRTRRWHRPGNRRDRGVRVSTATEPAVTTTPASTTLLQVRDLEVAYGAARALFGVSLDVPAGSVTAVLGANGAGKSSLAAAIAGVVTPSAGSIEFDGNDITGHERLQGLQARARVRAREPQPLPAPVRTRQPAGADSASRCRAHERKAALDRALEMFPILGERRRQQAGTLSGGEQQMLALARVLAAPPKLLIADEMSLGLAPKLVDLVFESLARGQGRRRDRAAHRAVRRARARVRRRGRDPAPRPRRLARSRARRRRRAPRRVPRRRIRLHPLARDAFSAVYTRPEKRTSRLS